MTYCIALKLDQGLVFLSDTRTNAGIDDVSRYRKLFTWDAKDRSIAIMTAGNLSITQGVIDRLERGVSTDGTGDDESIGTVKSMFRLAQIVGATMRKLVDRHRGGVEQDGASISASIILGGQIEGEAPRLFMIYSAGNFIECGEDTPYLQIGENKYGKPIIDRTINHSTSLAEGVRTALVSMDSTVRSNLSVGMPLDLAVIGTDPPRFVGRRRIVENDPTYRAISTGWSDALREALAALPNVDDWLDVEKD